MNKSELINEIAVKSGLNRKSCAVFLDAYVKSIEEALKNGEKVVIIGFGTFSVKNREARKGRNPQTKQEIMIPASKAPVFKAGKSLKDKVNAKSNK